MPKFRKKTTVIQAIRLMEPDLPADVAEWCGGRVCGVGDVGAKVWIEIDTPEGTLRADYGYYIAKGWGGEFYTVHPDVIESNYERVEE